MVTTTVHLSNQQLKMALQTAIKRSVETAGYQAPPMLHLCTFKLLLPLMLWRKSWTLYTLIPFAAMTHEPILIVRNSTTSSQHFNLSLSTTSFLCNQILHKTAKNTEVQLCFVKSLNWNPYHHNNKLEIVGGQTHHKPYDFKHEDHTFQAKSHCNRIWSTVQLCHY